MSRIHTPCTDGSSFVDMYPHYKQAVADPLRAYASLFFVCIYLFSVDRKVDRLVGSLLYAIMQLQGNGPNGPYPAQNIIITTNRISKN